MIPLTYMISIHCLTQNMYDTFHFSSSTFSANNIPLTLSHYYIYHHLPYLRYAAKQQPYVVTLQLTIYLTTSTSQYTIISYIFSALELRQFLQYLPKHKLESSSCYRARKDQQSDLVM